MLGGVDGEGAAASETAPEPTLDEVIASLEEILGQFEEAIVALTSKLEKFESSEKTQKGSGASITESLLKNPKPMVPVEDVAKMIRNVLPSPMVERSWGLGPQRMCQELRSVLLKLNGKVQ